MLDERGDAKNGGIGSGRSEERTNSQIEKIEKIEKN